MPQIKFEREYMKFTGLLLIVSSLFLAACVTAVPQSENFTSTKQKKTLAAQHWGLIANDAVSQTRLALAKQSIDKEKQPLYVADNTTTDFSRAFRKYMIAGLIDAGFVVSAKKEGAIEVDYEAQVIRHASSFDPQAFGYKPGMAIMGVTGFWILRDALRYSSTIGKALATAGAAGAVDYYNATNPSETGVELLISTSIVHNDRYVMLNADAYYIEKEEAWLFEGCKGKNRRLCR